MKEKKTINKINIENRKARFDYEFIDTYTAGMVLRGCEVKSIRNGDVNMSDSYCVFENDELYLKNMHISPYKDSGFAYKDYESKRDRKLLLTRHELRKLHQSVKTKGLTIIPVRLYSNEKGLMKIVVALAKGKHNYDKSKAIKERDLDREMKNL